MRKAIVNWSRNCFWLFLAWFILLALWWAVWKGSSWIIGHAGLFFFGGLLIVAAVTFLLSKRLALSLVVAVIAAVCGGLMLMLAWAGNQIGSAVTSVLAFPFTSLVGFAVTLGIGTVICVLRSRAKRAEQPGLVSAAKRCPDKLPRPEPVEPIRVTVRRVEPQ